MRRSAPSSWASFEPAGFEVASAHPRNFLTAAPMVPSLACGRGPRVFPGQFSVPPPLAISQPGRLKLLTRLCELAGGVFSQDVGLQ